MTFWAVYDETSHELIATYDEHFTDLDTGQAMKEFDGTVDGLTWNAETLDFAPTPDEPVDYVSPPDPWSLQQQIDDLTTAWLEG